MKKALLTCAIVVVGAAALTFSGCGSDYSSNSYGGGPRQPADTNTVNLGGSSFSPNNKTISVGTTITWKNTDGAVHTSTSDTGVWDTGNIPAGGSRTTTFNTAGTFPYHCTYHQSMGMTGTIVVQ